MGFSPTWRTPEDVFPNNTDSITKSEGHCQPLYLSNLHIVYTILCNRLMKGLPCIFYIIIVVNNSTYSQYIHYITCATSRRIVIPHRVVTKSLSSSPRFLSCFTILVVYQKVRCIVKALRNTQV